MEPSFEHFPLMDEVDHLILMHREVHFGGLFSVMCDYYRSEGKGIQPEFELKRIEELAELENKLAQNLAALFLTAQEMEKVADAKQAYKNLRKIFEVKKTKTFHPQLIAELILSEEEDPQKEMAAIVREGESIVPSLVTLLQQEDLRDPLFPGYGKAFDLIITCLKQIGDKRAIIPLFESIGQGDFFSDEVAINTLKALGEPAKVFLLKVLKRKPLNGNNEKAAIALQPFREDEEVACTALELLKDSDIQRNLCMSGHLLWLCAGLKNPNDRQRFSQLFENLPLTLKQDHKAVLREWGNQ